MRRAISLMEVLISLGLLTIGLLGVLSIFPVGAHFARQADIADNGHAVGRAVMSDLVARGMLDAERWTGIHPSNGVDPSNSYADELEANRLNLQSTNANTVKAANSLLGSVVVIDPLGVAAFHAYNNLNDSADPGYTSPLWLVNSPGRLQHQYFGQKAPTYWGPWKQSVPMGPLRRVTFPELMLLDEFGLQPTPADLSTDPLREADRKAIRVAAAERIVRARDDLALDFAADDQPSLQLASYSGPQALARQTAGDYSWMVTVAPTNAEARNDMAQGATCDVSVVVFYKRDFSIQPRPGVSAYTWNWSPSEALVPAAVKSTGGAGGELLVSEAFGAPALDGLQVGRWLAVCGPSPNSTPLRPQFFFAWYQVQAVDSEIAASDAIADAPQRYVTLRGPEWPWQPAANTGASALANDLCVAIYPSAVAVHSKTLRLE